MVIMGLQLPKPERVCLEKEHNATPRGASAFGLQLLLGILERSWCAIEAFPYVRSEHTVNCTIATFFCRRGDVRTYLFDHFWEPSSS